MNRSVDGTTSLVLVSHNRPGLGAASRAARGTLTRCSSRERPINYLRGLLRSTADFAWQARNKRPAAARRHEADQEAHWVVTMVQRNSGGVFFNANSSRRISVASDASTVTVHECGEAAPRVSAGNWQMDFVAAIERGHLVPATTEREAAFESKRQRGRDPRRRHRVFSPHTRCRGSSLRRQANDLPR
jgi:hypothetical protein